MLQICVDSPASATINMEKDREIFLRGGSDPVLRIYFFDRFSISCGIFSRKEKFLLLPVCEKKSIDVALRPTGGGVLFHGNDISFSLYLPSVDYRSGTLAQQINGIVTDSLRAYLKEPFGDSSYSQYGQGLCFSSITSYDIVWGMKKIGGGAQRRSKNAVLHQGSIFLKKPDWDTIEEILCNKEDLYTMQETIAPVQDLLQKNLSQDDLISAIIKNTEKFVYENSIGRL